MRLFWRKGYAATSIEDLTEALQLSRSSLYDTFGDKRTLFLSALKFYSERVVAHAAETLNGSSPLTAIQTLLDELAAGLGTESGAMGCFMVNSVAELVPYDADVTELAKGYSATMQRLVADALRDGKNQRAAEELAAYVFNTIQGLRLMIKAGATREQAEAIIAITMRNLQ